MTPQELKSSVLQYALQGRLVPQHSRTNVVSDVISSIRKNNALKSKKAKACVDVDSIEKPFDIPDSWAWITLGELCNIVNGFTPSRTNATFWENPTIAWFTVEDIHLQGRRIKATKQAINRCALSSNTDRIVPPGTVLLCCTASVGEYAIAEIPLTTNQQFNSLVIKDEYSGIFSSEFLFSIAPSFKDRLLNVAGKTTFNFISVKKVSEMLIPVPPIEEQNRIVAKLEEVLPLIDRYEVAWNKLEAFNKRFPGDMQRSILQLAIQGKLVEQRPEEGTGEELFQQIQVEKQALIKAGKIKKEKPVSEIVEDEVPFEIPNSWRWVHLNQIAISNLGKTLDKAKNTGELCPYLCSINVYWSGIDLSKVKEARFEEAEQEKYLLQQGDLLVCEGGDCGRAAIWESEQTMYYQNALHRIRFYGNIDPHFYRFLLEYYKKAGIIEQYSKGETIKHLVQNALYAMWMPLPPLAEQKRIVAKLEEILPLCDRLK